MLFPRFGLYQNKGCVLVLGAFNGTQPSLGNNLNGHQVCMIHQMVTNLINLVTGHRCS